MSAALSLRPLGKALGIEVAGVDVSRPFDAATLEWIDRAFADHPVMVFRNQRLGPTELAAFGSQFAASAASRAPLKMLRSSSMPGSRDARPGGTSPGCP